MCAGISSRFGGKIKQFAEVGPKGETLIEYSLNQALKAGFNKIVFIVGNKTEKPFKEKFGDEYNGIPIFYALQTYNPEERDKPWGTADALVSAYQFLDCPFLICNGDDIYGENTFRLMKEKLNENKEGIIPGYKLVNVLPKSGSVNRALLNIESGYLKSMKEIFDITKENLKERGLEEESLVSMNAFGLNKEVIDMIKQRVDEFKDQNKGDRKKECLLPNEIGELIKLDKIKISCHPTKDSWVGITNPEDEEIVRKELKNVNE